MPSYELNCVASRGTRKQKRIALFRPLTKDSRETLDPLFRTLRAIERDTGKFFQEIRPYSSETSLCVSANIEGAIPSRVEGPVQQEAIKANICKAKREQLAQRIPTLGLAGAGLEHIRKNFYTFNLLIPEVPYTIYDELAVVERVVVGHVRGYEPKKAFQVGHIRVAETLPEYVEGEIAKRLKNCETPEVIELQPLLHFSD